jgi:hypothetical protein
MKKFLVIMMVVMVTAFAAAAFAVTTITNSTPVTVAGAPFTPSANVVISAASNTVNYAATSAHASAASGPGYQYLIMDTFNGIQKKQWATGETSPASWPTPVTSPTSTLAGFTQ